ncbi:MAG: sigma-70 family RNA polymerase sigma factor [Cyclobacteriaceae bacterium]|nr:sigma-70 family RNA polymerase sigma factor [Cyclobacteriaceae bacterium]
MFQKTAASKEVILPDDALVRHAKQGPANFQPLYEAYFSRIYMFILYRVADKDTAGDLAQQTFLNAMLNIQNYEMRGVPFSSWLYRIALNQCNAYYRKAKRERTIVLEEKHMEDLVEELIDTESMDEWKQSLPRVLGELKAADLQIIELRFLDGRPFREVGEILGISENLAKVRTYRVLDRMKKMLTTI